MLTLTELPGAAIGGPRRKVDPPPKEARSMYTFAVVALLGLAVLKIADLLEGFVPGLARFNALLTYALAIGATVALDYSMFKAWHIGVPDAWMGPWFTGFVIASFATVWRVAFRDPGSAGGQAAGGRPHPPPGGAR